MNYLNYFIDGGGFPVKRQESDNKLFNVKGYLIRDDWDKVFEKIRSFFHPTEKNNYLSAKNTSGNVVGIKNGIAYFGNTFPDSDNNYYFWTNKNANNKPIPSWIQFQS